MRVSNQMIYNNLADYLQQNNDALLVPEQQIASGQNINLPSDDPLAFAKVVNLNDVTGKLNQYLNNQNDALSYMNATNNALDQASKVIADIIKTADNAESGQTPQTQQYNSLMVTNDFQALVDAANTTYQGQYLFAGFKSNAAAYNNSGVYQGDSGQIMIQVAPGVSSQRNLVGQDVFGTASGGVDIFAAIQNLQTAVSTNNLAGIQSALVSLNAGQQQVLSNQGMLAERMVSVQTNQTYVKGLSSTTSHLLGGIQSVDMNLAITQLNQQATALQAVQAMSAKVMNLSIVNFLK